MQVEDKSAVNARISGAFRMASKATGVSFERLVATAARESDGRPDLASTTSSAKGLFQFVDQTWLELVKKEGAAVGLGRLSDQIASDGRGGWTVADPTEKAKILSLRTDPLVSSVMAAKFTQANTRGLTENLGRAPTDGEVYAAHVLGVAGATRLIRLARTDPDAAASVAFPKAAAANPGLFYAGGKARTVSDLLGRLSGGDVGARIADAHAAVSTEATPKLDPTALATMIRAQASAAVAAEGMSGGPVDRLVAARFAQFAFAEKSLPGAAAGSTPPAGPMVDGWRAKTPSDAFSLLMRSDEATESSDAGASPADEGLSSARLAAFAATTHHAVGGAAGGIPYVDPNQPLNLLGQPTAASAAATPTNRNVSQLVSARAAAGAPAMPLPMVDETGTVVRPSRLVVPTRTTANLGAALSGLAASDAARVKTVSIEPTTVAAVVSSTAAAAASSATRARAASDAAAVRPRTAAPSRAAPRDNRPLDLLSLAGLATPT